MSLKDFIKENKVYDKSTNVCPICSGKIVGSCRCMVGSRTCENHHEWYTNNGFVYEGNGHKVEGKRLMMCKGEYNVK
jgi:hypothetical protein